MGSRIITDSILCVCGDFCVVAITNVTIFVVLYMVVDRLY